MKGTGKNKAGTAAEETKSIFLDSNILLNFYDFHDEDLNQLGKLVDMINDGSLILYLTKQVCHEVKKNREYRLAGAYSKFITSKSIIPMPVFCKHYDEYSSIRKAQQLLEKLKSHLSKKLWDDIQNNNLKADAVIKSLTAHARIIDSDEYLDEAIERHRFGRPPGKKDRSFGDEINWESLMSEVDKGGQFVIISKDGDYASAIDESRLKDYLSEEWKEKRPDTEIFFYKSLSAFFREHDIKIELRVEQEKDDLVRSLINSPNFLTTHDIISKLNKYSAFSDDQIRGMGTALLENSQVHWLNEDADVKDFYEEHLREELFEPDSWKSICSYLARDEKIEEFAAEIEKIGKTIEQDSIKPADAKSGSEDIPF